MVSQTNLVILILQLCNQHHETNNRGGDSPVVLGFCRFYISSYKNTSPYRPICLWFYSAKDNSYNQGRQNNIGSAFLSLG